MGDVDVGYLYYMHDKIEEAKELSSSGNSLMSSGIFVIILSLVLAYVFGKPEFLALALLGIALFVTGMHRHSKVERLHLVEEGRNAARKKELEKRITVEVHDEPSVHRQILSGPSILRHRLARPFSEEVSLHLKERGLIAQVIRQNSGSDINSVYRIYRLGGGSYDSERFVKALHGLKRHGFVNVSKTVSQASLMPASST
ncbi:hypothetical protein HYU15_03425 [Candidatus Woesearchaeota archaeon]|nr:hypothetical protein [Candidatus Woesearchaeota archaeon]